MSLIIKGMKMPETMIAVFISRDGKVFPVNQVYRGKDWENVKAIPLPEKHGRLGDLDALRKEFPEPEDWKDFAQAVQHITGIWATIDSTPTIIPAEGGTDDG